MVLFGSNLGTAEGIASRIAQDGSDRGYAVTLGALDDHTGELPHEGALVVVCASYNGKPPDNAERFCRWITDPATPPDAGSGLAYSVFGCGNMDWASTYQAVPTLIDTAARSPRRASNARPRRRRRPLRLRRPVLGVVPGIVVIARRRTRARRRVDNGVNHGAAATAHHGEQADNQSGGDVLPSSIRPPWWSTGNC